MVIVKKRDIQMSRVKESLIICKYSELEKRMEEQNKKIDSLIDRITALQSKIESLKLNKCSGCGDKKELPPCPSWPPPPGYIPEWPPSPRDPIADPDHFLEFNPRPSPWGYHSEITNNENK